MKKMILLLAVVAVCIFGMQKKLQDVKDRIQMLRAAGVPEQELADLQEQERELEDQLASESSRDDFETKLARWKMLAAPTTEEQVIEKSRLEYEMLDELAEQSKSRWFYTGDLLDKVLEIKGTPIANKPPFGLIIEVPRDVRRDLSNPLVYLVSFQQIYNTCGFHALANAYAVTKQINEKKPITYEQTRKIAQQIFQKSIEPSPDFAKLACPNNFNEPEYSDLLAVIKKLGLRSHFDEDPNFFLVDNTNINDPSVQPIQAQQIRFSPVINFMYRTPNHFLIISVVNNDDNYTMFMLDSANGPLQVGGERARFVAHIDNLIQMAKDINISEESSGNFESEQMRRQREAEEEKKKNESSTKKRKQGSSSTQEESESSDESTEPELDQSEMNRRIVRQFNQELSEDPTIQPYEEITELWDNIRDKARAYLGKFSFNEMINTIHLIAQGLGTVPDTKGKLAIRANQHAYDYYKKLRVSALKKAHSFVEQEKYTQAIGILRPFTPDTDAQIIKIYIQMINDLAKQSKQHARSKTEEALEDAKSLEREINFFEQSDEIDKIRAEFQAAKVELEALHNNLK